MAKNFETHGIHTRLKVLIKKSGGLNWEYRIEYLVREFNLSTEDAIAVKGYDYEEWFKKNTHEEIMEYVNKREYQKELEYMKLKENPFYRMMLDSAKLLISSGGKRKSYFN